MLFVYYYYYSDKAEQEENRNLSVPTYDQITQTRSKRTNWKTEHMAKDI